MRSRRTIWQARPHLFGWVVLLIAAVYLAAILGGARQNASIDDLLSSLFVGLIGGHIAIHKQRPRFARVLMGLALGTALVGAYLSLTRL
jgi:uncharacterized membrane protein YjjB (DUF3815 family)